MYINALQKYISSESIARLFADGCVLYRRINSKVDTHKLQKDLDQERITASCQEIESTEYFKGTVRGAFGKFLAWSFISVTDLQTLSCLISI